LNHLTKYHSIKNSKQSIQVVIQARDFSLWL